MTKEEKEFIKSYLKRWGEAFERIKEIRERIEELDTLCRESGDIAGISYDTIKISGGQAASKVERAVMKTIMVYEAEMDELESEIEDILYKKTVIDKFLSKMENDEKKILSLRYRSGLCWDNIPDIVHRSRKQCFRIHDKALEKLMSLKASIYDNMTIKGIK